MWLNNIYESLVVRACPQPVFIFSVIIAENLMTVSIAISGFSCLAAQS